MKEKNKTKKDFDTVKVFRDIKEQISKEIHHMTYEELVAYFEKTKIKPQSIT